MNRHLLQNRKHFVALVLAAIALFWFAANHNSHFAQAKYKVPEVSLAEAKALMEQGAIVIDVRGQEQFVYRHLPAALLIPLAVLRAGVPLSLLAAKTQPVLVYCNEGLSHGPEAAHILQQAGFTHVVNLKSGIEGWAGAGLPVKTGAV